MRSRADRELGRLNRRCAWSVLAFGVATRRPSRTGDHGVRRMIGLSLTEREVDVFVSIEEPPYPFTRVMHQELQAATPICAVTIHPSRKGSPPLPLCRIECPDA